MRVRVPSLPTKLPPCTENQMSPLWSKVSVCGSRASGVGIIIFSMSPGLRVEAADVQWPGCPRTRRIPSSSTIRFVGTGARVELVAPEVTCLRVEIGEVVAPLPDEPDPPLAVDVRVARPGVLPGNHPLGDLDVLGCGRGRPERAESSERNDGRQQRRDSSSHRAPHEGMIMKTVPCKRLRRLRLAAVHDPGRAARVLSSVPARLADAGARTSSLCAASGSTAGLAESAPAMEPIATLSRSREGGDASRTSVDRTPSEHADDLAPRPVEPHHLAERAQRRSQAVAAERLDADVEDLARRRVPSGPTGPIPDCRPLAPPVSRPIDRLLMDR